MFTSSFVPMWRWYESAVSHMFYLWTYSIYGAFTESLCIIIKREKDITSSISMIYVDAVYHIFALYNITERLFLFYLLTNLCFRTRVE